MSESLQNRQLLSLKNRTSDSSKLSDFLADYALTTDIPSNAVHDLRLVLEETFINIISYAFNDDDSHKITVEFNCSATMVSISFIDDGTAFNPLMRHSGTEQAVENSNHCEGGMGIHLIKSLTDQQQYNRIKERNVFTVTKHYTNDHA